jgi:hypothetical protein
MLDVREDIFLTKEDRKRTQITENRKSPSPDGIFNEMIK